MDDLLNSIKLSLREIFPSLSPSYIHSGSPSQLAQFMSKYPNLPKCVVEYLIQFNGEGAVQSELDEIISTKNGLFIDLRLLSLEEIATILDTQSLDEKSVESIPSHTIQPVKLHPDWIPLLVNRDGQFLGIDMAPGPKGTVGQVIVWGSYFDKRLKLADDWEEFLRIVERDLKLNGHMFDVDPVLNKFETEADYLEFLYFEKLSQIERDRDTEMADALGREKEMEVNMVPDNLEAEKETVLTVPA